MQRHCLTNRKTGANRDRGERVHVRPVVNGIRAWRASRPQDAVTICFGRLEPDYHAVVQACLLHSEHLTPFDQKFLCDVRGVLRTAEREPTTDEKLRVQTIYGRLLKKASAL